MRRTFLSARPSRAAVFRAFGSPQAQSRRTFATPPTKDDSPPSPIEPSKTQAHPVGPFYEAVLRTPQSVPQKKPEEPPVSSQQSSAPAPEEKSTAADEDKAAADAKAAPKRTRKPRQTKDETPSSSSKTKSVPPSSSSSSSFSSTTPSSSSSPDARTLPPQSEPDLESPPSSSNTTSQQQHQSNNRITFAASLAGPSFTPSSGERGELIAGVLVPPRPLEPDNCCMSGCVNCVWDRYRDEMDLWADRAAEAERRVRAAEVGEEVGVTEGVMDEVTAGRGGKGGGGGRGMDLGWHDEVADRTGEGEGGGVVGMEDDGGRITKDFWDEELYKHVPVGIREFMKQEKRLKEKHRRQGTLGG